MGTVKNQAPPDPNVISRIKKLLALAGDKCNEHEASLAMEKASELLLLHDLNMSDISTDIDNRRYGVTETAVELGTMTMKWKVLLLHYIAKHNMCVMISTNKSRTMILVGRPDNIGVTREMFDWMSSKLVVLCAEDRMRHGRGVDPMRWRASWCAGAVMRIGERLHRSREAEKSKYRGTTALVVMSEENNEKYISKFNPSCGAKKISQSVGSAAAFGLGAVAGNAVSLRPAKMLTGQKRLEG